MSLSSGPGSDLCPWRIQQVPHWPPCLHSIFHTIAGSFLKMWIWSYHPPTSISVCLRWLRTKSKPIYLAPKAGLYSPCPLSPVAHPLPLPGLCGFFLAPAAPWWARHPQGVSVHATSSRTPSLPDTWAGWQLPPSDHFLLDS